MNSGSASSSADTHSWDMPRKLLATSFDQPSTLMVDVARIGAGAEGAAGAVAATCASSTKRRAP